MSVVLGRYPEWLKIRLCSPLEFNCGKHTIQRNAAFGSEHCILDKKIHFSAVADSAFWKTAWRTKNFHPVLLFNGLGLLCSILEVH